MSSDVHQEARRGLLELEAEQKTFRFGDVSVGGQPGVRPVVLIGSIFYHGHKIIVDEDEGDFRRADAEKLIRAQEAFAERTGNPCMLDVVGSTPKALQRHLEFAAGVTGMPLLIDGTTAEVRLAGARYAAEAGLSDRVLYNSVQPEITDEELSAIRETGLDGAVILAYYLMDFTTRGRFDAVRKLLPRVRDAGMRRLIVDLCVMDLATLGQAGGAMFDVKDRLGLPAGGGVHNAVAMWRGLETKMGRGAYHPCVAAAAASAVAMGADFILYGPIEDAEHVFPAVAMVDAALSQLSAERGRPPVENHPRFRIG